MHAIAGLDITVCQPLCNALVGEQHSFLDKRRGTRTLTRHNLHGHSVLIQQSTNLGRVKIDRAAGATDTTAEFGEFVSGDKEIAEVDVVAAGGLLARKTALKRFLARGLGSRNILGCTLQHRILNRAGTHQQRLGAVIVHTHTRANHAWIRIVMPHATLRIELDIDGKRKTVLVRAKRAQVTGQAFGQHGKHAIGQIHRCRAMASLKIDMPVPSHIV